jgi:hypothetical protein
VSNGDEFLPGDGNRFPALDREFRYPRRSSLYGLRVREDDDESDIDRENSRRDAAERINESRDEK